MLGAELTEHLAMSLTHPATNLQEQPPQWHVAQ